MCYLNGRWISRKEKLALHGRCPHKRRLWYPQPESFAVAMGDVIVRGLRRGYPGSWECIECGQPKRGRKWRYYICG